MPKKPNPIPTSNGALATSEDDEEEAEMVSLLPPPSPCVVEDRKSGGLSRRTPGPSNGRRYRSEEEFNRRSATPVMSGNSQRKQSAPSNLLTTPSIKPNAADNNNGMDRSRQLYTPAHFTLSKNPHLHMDGSRPEVFSPNTIRMTDSLDKLLRDDDEDDLDASNGIPDKNTMPEHPAPMVKDAKKMPYAAPFPYPAGEATSGGAGAFRRIQSTASSESLDEEMAELQNMDGEAVGVPDERKAGNSPKPLNFDGRPGGAFEPPKPSMKRMYGHGVEGVHTPKPQRTVPRAPAQLHPPQHHSMHYDLHYQGNNRAVAQHHDPFFSQPYSSMHYPTISPQMVPLNNGFGHMGVVSPLTIPDYPHGSHYPSMHHAPSWSPTPPEFGPPGRDQWQPPPPAQRNVMRSAEFYPPDVAGYDNRHPHHPFNPHGQYDYGMDLPGHASPDFGFHAMPGHVSPFMPHYIIPENDLYHQHPMAQPHVHHPHALPAPRQRSRSRDEEGRKPKAVAPLTPPRKSEKPDGGGGFSSSPREGYGRPRKNSSASANSGVSSSASLDESPLPSFERSPVPPNSALRQAPPGLRSVSSEDEMGPSAKSSAGGSFARQVQQSFYFGASLEGGGDNIPPDQLTGDKKQGKNHSLKQSKDRMSSKGMRPRTAISQGGIPKNEDDKRSEFESPAERAAFKEFGRQFRQKENESLDAARGYALACLSEVNADIYLPPATHWRVYLELADVAKRCNEIDSARSYYRKSCKLQPLASQGWLEHSKLEEESGNLSSCAAILEEGLRYCTTNENLLIRAVKFHERVGQLDEARKLLGRLKNLPIERAWKSMLEGALLEARAGKYLTVAREILKYLTHYVPWYGPLYLAHTRLESLYGSPADAFAIVEKGLKELPRYGPLYFQAFCLLEKEDLSRKAYHLPRTMKMVSRADNISRELLWKVQLEAALIQERAAAQQVQNNPRLNLKKCLAPTRRSFAKAMMLASSTSPNLCWKIWLASGRTEVSCGNTDEARVLFHRAYESVSEKGRSAVLLECARLEEFCGRIELARAILCKARTEFGKNDWKVWLASVNLECRCGLKERATAFAQKSLQIHSGTGRLWASLIQLRHENGEMEQVNVLKRALQAVPKSGEVWCEGARIFLNPFSPTFDLQAAARHLSFAARFTPQYGDSFLEQLRLDMICQWLVKLAEPLIEDMHASFLSQGKMNLKDAYYFIGERVKDAADVMKAQQKASKKITKGVLDTSDLELHCSSADPNYGHVWFHCRKSPIDTACEVINNAKSMLAVDIEDYSFIYVAAMVRRAGILMIINYQADMINLHTDSGGTEQFAQNGLPSPHSNEWDITINTELRKAPSLNEMLWDRGAQKNVLNELSSQMFVTCHVESNKSWDQLSQTEKQRILFGSDSLLS